jgi:hypothetical protein
MSRAAAALESARFTKGRPLGVSGRTRRAVKAELDQRKQSMEERGQIVLQPQQYNLGRIQKKTKNKTKIQTCNSVNDSH